MSGLSDTIAPATNILSDGFASIGQYKILIYAMIGLAVIAGIVYMLYMFKKKKNQWTHKFKVKRILQNGVVTPEITHLARRFPKQQGVEVFELEKPLLGSYLIPAPGEYTDVNVFSIILDADNRIWQDKGTTFNKDTQSMELSAVHAGIDVEMHTMKERWQEAHSTNKKITAMEMIAAGLKAIMIIAILIMGIVGMGEWGDSQTARATMATAEATAMENLAKAVETMETTVNTQQLQLIPMLKALYGTDNIAGKIKDYCVEEEDEILE